MLLQLGLGLGVMVRVRAYLTQLMLSLHLCFKIGLHLGELFVLSRPKTNTQNKYLQSSQDKSKTLLRFS